MNWFSWKNFTLGLSGTVDVLEGWSNTHLGTAFSADHAAQTYAEQTAEAQAIAQGWTSEQISEHQAIIYSNAVAAEGVNAQGLDPAISATEDQVGSALSSALSWGKWILAGAAGLVVAVASTKLAEALS